MRNPMSKSDASRIQSTQVSATSQLDSASSPFLVVRMNVDSLWCRLNAAKTCPHAGLPLVRSRPLIETRMQDKVPHLEVGLLVEGVRLAVGELLLEGSPLAEEVLRIPVELLAGVEVGLFGEALRTTENRRLLAMG